MSYDHNAALLVDTSVISIGMLSTNEGVASLHPDTPNPVVLVHSQEAFFLRAGKQTLSSIFLVCI
jgi:hypothetical protein